MSIYVVQAGDTIDRIAGVLDTTVAELSYINQIPYPYQLAVGQALLAPQEIETGENEETKRGIISRGYAYPFISRFVLQQTLPYLTDLLVFSYGFTTEGELIPPTVDADWMLEETAKYGANPVLVLTPLGEDGRFNNNLIHVMVTDNEVKEKLISELLLITEEKGYRGIDVDFEYILAEDRDLFTAFVAELRERANENGVQVSVALAPKTSATQQGLLYEGKDYQGLGEAANDVLLMTYEWGYAYGPPMAVAPLNKVRQVVEYAQTEIASEKTNLGIPNYGYDWTLPFIRGESRAKTIGNIEAVQIAIQNGAVIQFDEIAQSPYFQYEREGELHEVWFEDVRSLQAKYELVKEFNLRGIGVWQIMRLYRASWLLLAEKFYIQ